MGLINKTVTSTVRSTEKLGEAMKEIATQTTKHAGDFLVNYTPDIYNIGQFGEGDYAKDTALFGVGNSLMVGRGAIRGLHSVNAQYHAVRQFGYWAGKKTNYGKLHNWDAKRAFQKRKSAMAWKKGWGMKRLWKSSKMMASNQSRIAINMALSGNSYENRATQYALQGARLATPYAVKTGKYSLKLAYKSWKNRRKIFNAFAHPIRTLNAFISAMVSVITSTVTTVTSTIITVILPIIGILFMLMIVFVLIFGTTSSTCTFSGVTTDGSVEGNKNAMWIYLRGNTLPDGSRLSPEQVAGIMGNVQQESGFNASIIQGGQAYNEAKANSGDYGYAFGFLQWDGSRRIKLLREAKEQGVDWTDPVFQLDYIWKEVFSSGSSYYRQLKNRGFFLSRSARECADIWNQVVEVSADTSGKRGDNAEALLSSLNTKENFQTLSCSLNGSLEGHPDFTNIKAWRPTYLGGTNNLQYGQCTWYTYGVWFEVYGKQLNLLDSTTTSFSADGWKMADSLVERWTAYFTIQYEPKAGSVMSYTDYNHVGFVLGVKDDELTLIDGHYGDCINHPHTWDWSIKKANSYADGTGNWTIRVLKWKSGSVFDDGEWKSVKFAAPIR